MKKNLQRLLGALLAVVLLVGAVPAFAADPDGSLNPETCIGAEFDESVYDAVGHISDAKNGKFDWPSSGTVLLKAAGTNWSVSKCKGITIPAGLVVDIYQYHANDDREYVYELIGHYDTTDGSAYTIGSSSSNTGTSGNSGSSSNSSRPGNSLNEDWGEVEKVFTSSVKSDTYGNAYTDVPSDMWCYDAIMVLTEGGLLNGYGGGKFGPNDTLTRAQLAFVRTRLVGNEVKGSGDLLGYKSYEDNTTADRAFAAISLAGRLSRIGGTVGLTEYETSLVRNAGGLATGISSSGRFGDMWGAVYDNWRASLDGGKDPSTYISSVDDLPDAATIHQWIEEHWELMGKVLLIQESKDVIVKACEDAICRAYNLGMIAGVDGQGTFSPYAPLTRGQLATILWRAGWIDSGCLNYR